jgi:hypothetical protein
MFGDRRRIRAAAEILRRWRDGEGEPPDLEPPQHPPDGANAIGPREPEPPQHPPDGTNAIGPREPKPPQHPPDGANAIGPREPKPPQHPPDGASTLAAMEGDVNQTLGELERRLKELERELEAVGRSGEVGAEPAQGGWIESPPPRADVPPGTTPFTATWSGGSAQQAPEPPPTPNGAPPIPVRPPYWQPLAPPAAEEPQSPQQPQPQSPPQPPAATAPEPDAAAPEIQWVPAPQPPPQPASHEPPAPEPAAQEQAAPPAASAGLHRQLDELLAFRERLVRSTNELVAELSRVLTDLGAEMEADEPAQPDPADTVLTGDVVVEAGPFGDLATLAAFEQALQRTDGVAAVHVRALNDGHATIDVALDEPTRLAAALRERAVVAEPAPGSPRRGYATVMPPRPAAFVA